MAITAIENEGSSLHLVVRFFGYVGLPDVPTSVIYRIDCLTTGEEVLTDTPLTPVAAVMEVEITPEENRILGANSLEHRRVTFVAAYGFGEAKTEQFDYQIRNLGGAGS